MSAEAIRNLTPFNRRLKIFPIEAIGKYLHPLSDCVR